MCCTKEKENEDWRKENQNSYVKNVVMNRQSGWGNVPDAVYGIK